MFASGKPHDRKRARCGQFGAILSWMQKAKDIPPQNAKQLPFPSGFAQRRAMKSISYSRGKGYTSCSPPPVNGLDCRGTLLLISLGFVTFASSCLSAISLYHMIALKADLAVLSSKLNCRVQTMTSFPVSLGALDEIQEARDLIPRLKVAEAASRQGISSGLHQSSQEIMWSRNRRKRSSPHVGEADGASIVPWLLSFKRGTALQEQGNKILVREAGYFFIYGQVLYTDELFVMGHLIQRKKANVVGDDLSLVTLFRCIQNMPQANPNNSCYTAGIARLEEGDELQLTIPRRGAKIALDGDATFFGAVRLL
ncbi:tumor necrosis factor ligand superfamily member 13B isoform X2 [Eublepharis macularius]|uniref:Tumor necrosis factor ligand superfamily member 13B isoform X2 n=1 Tax=Eublepharis macularius TaxID=481883 RepID=A0AA97LLN5_EUBMA|nr:tumor necrosis factor ligand superfamily member 13B isoform X2 [Eublepharis macularius]